MLPEHAIHQIMLSKCYEILYLAQEHDVDSIPQMQAIVKDIGSLNDKKPFNQILSLLTLYNFERATEQLVSLLDQYDTDDYKFAQIVVFANH